MPEPDESNDTGGFRCPVKGRFLFCGTLVAVLILFVYISTSREQMKGSGSARKEVKEAEVILDRLVVPKREEFVPVNNTDVPATTSKQESLFLSAAALGRLGNLLFQYASAYGVARTVSKRLHVLQSNELLGAYPAIRTYAYVTKSYADIRDRVGVGDPANCAYVTAVVDQSRAPRNISMDGYYQSYRYFDTYREDLRRHLSFRSDIQKQAESRLQDVRARASATFKPAYSEQLFWVAVHVRRGDIITNPEMVNFGYLVPSADYLKKSTEYFVAKYATKKRPIVFLVFSDDLAWCKQNFVVGGEADLVASSVHVEFSGSESREVDMQMMVLCNATIMTVGSFGWWSAYLSGGETLYYAYPYRPGSLLARQFVMQDYYLPEWRAMS